MSTSATSPRFLAADKRGWPRKAVNFLIQHKLRTGLHRILGQGVPEIRRSLAEEPGGTLFLANHSCWWDLFFVHFWNETLPVDGYGMMEHFNLVRFGFFRRIGAFSVDRTDPASVRQSLDYAADLLRRPGSAVWIFPQGRINSNDDRPIVFQPGIRALLRRAGRVRVVPVAFRYDFWQDERPEAFARFGPATWVDRQDWPALIPTFERRMTEELDQLRAEAITQDLTRFESFRQGKASVSERYARFLGRIRRKAVGV